MPLVITKSGDVHYVKYRETLVEILEHSNFDGEEWAIGDRLIFEDGTESHITQEPGELSYCWKKPTTIADFDEVRGLVSLPNARDWKELFSAFEAESSRSGCLATLLVVGALVLLIG
jgi:hypothetical protein